MLNAVLQNMELKLFVGACRAFLPLHSYLLLRIHFILNQGKGRGPLSWVLILLFASLSACVFEHILPLFFRPVSDKPGPELDPPYKETWEAMEKLKDDGLVRSIGNIAPQFHILARRLAFSTWS